MVHYEQLVQKLGLAAVTHDRPEKRQRDLPSVDQNLVNLDFLSVPGQQLFTL